MMKLDVSRVDVWAGSIQDRPGGLAEILAPLAEAGVNLNFMISRRAPDEPGTGVVFLTPVQGAAQSRAARKAGLQKTNALHSVRVDGPDKRGLGAAVTAALADAGINLRGLSAAAIGRKSVMFLAFDTTADAGKAARVLKKL